MPNRVIKDSIKCSREIDSLTWFQEVMFYRLMVTVDDFGRYYADPQIIKSELFPTKENLTKRDVADGLERLADVGLVNLYEVDGTPYLEITKWMKHQQRRATKSKFPQMISNDINCNQLQSIDINCNQAQANDSNGNQLHPNTKSNTKTKTKTKARARVREDPDPAAFMTTEEAKAIQEDHNDLYDAMKKIGLPETEYNREQIIDLYGQYGKEPVMHGMREAARLNKISVGYIESVAKNYGTPKPEADDGQYMSDEEGQALFAAMVM